MKSYIILKKGYEYNDEIYSEFDSGAGRPHRVFLNRESANKECQKLDIKEFKETNITEYAYDIEDVLNCTESELLEYCKSLNDKYGKPESISRWDRPDDYRLNANATEEESIKYANMVGLSFFSVEECEVDIQDLRDYQITQIIE
jgi:hypothetical protein